MDWGGGGPGGEDGNPDNNPGGGPRWYWGGFDPRTCIVPAPIGTVFIQTGGGGGLWVKEGPDDEDWVSKITPPVPVQIVPNADGANMSGGWTGTYALVDELTPSDADYMVYAMPDDGTTRIFEVNLTPSVAGDWTGWTNAQVAVRSAYTPVAITAGTLELRRVSNNALLKSTSGAMGPGVAITRTLDMTVAEIEPYLADLKIRFTIGPVQGDGMGGSPSNARVHWAQLYSVD